VRGEIREADRVHGTEAEDEAKGFELGAVDYIHKPFNPTVVRARVHTHLLLRDTLKQIEEPVEETYDAMMEEEPERVGSRVTG